MRPLLFKAARVLGVVLGLGAAGYGAWRILNPAGPPAGSPAQRAEAIRTDRELLADPKARPQEVYGALVRLAQRRDAHARQEAVRRASDPERVVREGVARALGHFEDAESLAIVKKMLGDATLTVRIQALKGLAERPGEAREQAIRAFLARNPQGRERSTALASLIRISKDASAKKGWLRDLVKVATGSSDVLASTSAALEALSVGPREPEVVEMLKGFLSSGKSLPVLPTAIRHLSALGDPWIASRLSSLRDNPDHGVRLAAVQSLHSACPSDRWSVLEAALRGERDRQIVAAAIDEAGYMPGADAQALLDRMIRENVLSGGELDRAKKVLEGLKTSTGSDPCAGRG